MVTVHRLHHDVALDAGQALQLLGDDRRLELPLRGGLGVLEVAAAAQTRPRPRARGLATAGRRGVDPDGVGGEVSTAAADPGDRGRDPLTGQGVPDEDDAALVPGDAVTAVRDRTDVELQAVPDIGHGASSSSLGPSAGRGRDPLLRALIASLTSAQCSGFSARRR